MNLLEKLGFKVNEATVISAELLTLRGRNFLHFEKGKLHLGYDIHGMPITEYYTSGTYRIKLRIQGDRTLEIERYQREPKIGSVIRYKKHEVIN